jgi:hypothetical protein
MAVITIIVRDAVGPNGEDGVTVEIKSENPPMPTKDGTLDADEATVSQLVAFGAVMEICGLAKTNELLVSPTQGE